MESHLVISPWRRPTVLQAAADRYTAAGVPSNRLKLTALRARLAAAARLVRRFLHGLRRPRALVLTAQRAELCGWSVHLIATSAVTRKIIALTRMEDALPVRDQDGNSGSGTSGQPKAEEYYHIDPSSVNAHSC